MVLRILLAVFLTPLFAQAMWIDFAPEELLKETDYVVIASLSDVKKWTRHNTDFGRGTLNVTEVLSKNALPKSPLILTWANPSNIICPRTEHGDTKGQAYIWLLQTGRDGTVTANHPGQTLSLKEKKKIQKLIKKQKL